MVLFCASNDCRVSRMTTRAWGRCACSAWRVCTHVFSVCLAFHPLVHADDGERPEVDVNGFADRVERFAAGGRFAEKLIPDIRADDADVLGLQILERVKKPPKLDDVRFQFHDILPHTHERGDVSPFVLIGGACARNIHLRRDDLEQGGVALERVGVLHGDAGGVVALVFLIVGRVLVSRC